MVECSHYKHTFGVRRDPGSSLDSPSNLLCDPELITPPL